MKKSLDLNGVLITFESILLLLGQFSRINLPYGISFYMLELFVFFHVIFLLATNSEKLKTSNISLLAKIGILWTALVVVVLFLQSFSFSAVENLRALSYLLRITNFGLFAFLIAQNTPKKALDRILTIISFLIPLTALLQYFLLPDLRFLASYGWDPHMYRAVGTIFDPPIMGSILGMLFIHRIVIGNEKKVSAKETSIAIYKNKNVYLYSLTSICILFAIVLLFSRSTYLAVLIAVNYVLLTKHRFLNSTIFTILFIVAIILAPKTIPAYGQLESAKIERISTVTSRKTEILAGIDAFVRNPIWGIGYNRVREYKNKSSVDSGQLSVKNETLSTSNHAGSAFHSFWVTQLATTGVLGFGLLLWFFAELIRKKPQLLAVIFIPAFVGLFDNTMFHPFVLITLIFLYTTYHFSKSKS